MISSNVRIRLVTFSDSQNLLLWRNDPLTRINSINHEIVTIANHEKWFASILQRDDCVVYVADISSPKEGEISCGMCRFDVSQDGKSSVVSINLNPHYRGLGLSLNILTRSIETFTQQHQEVIMLEAEIRESNLPSISIFTRAGFSKITDDSEVGRYSLAVN
jgi:L-amino acid N-acyltransferase YncA